MMTKELLIVRLIVPRLKVSALLLNILSLLLSRNALTSPSTSAGTSSKAAKALLYELVPLPQVRQT
jgi:hypothetical protein